MRAIDETRPVFVLAPRQILGQDTMKLYADFDFSKRPNVLSNRDDWHRVMGLEQFHVIQLVSPRRFVMSSRERDEYDFIVTQVRRRWEERQGRHGSIGNMWIEFNLP